MSRRLPPPQATELERSLADVFCRHIDALTAPFETMRTADGAPPRYLSRLAWDLAAPEWREDWNETVRRRTVAATVAVHRRRGTTAAVQDALRAHDFTARVTEWHQAKPAGRPYTFAIDVELRDRALTAGDYNAALGTTLRAKNLRSHLDRLTVWQTVDGTVRAAAGTLAHETISVYPPAPADAAGAAAAAILAVTLVGDGTQLEIEL